MKIKKYNACIFCMLIVGLCLPEASAYAFGQGTVTGTVRAYNKLGHYCPDDGSRSCYGSTYNEADFGRYQPLRDMKLYLNINGIRVGYGTTDASGNYTVEWFYPDAGHPTNATLELFLEQKDGHFAVRDPDGTSHRLYAHLTINFGLDTTTDFGTLSWGSAGAPLPETNTYEAAWRTWHYAFSHSGRLISYFNNLDIVDGGPGSYFDSDEFAAYVSTIQEYEYETVYHEMGHAASMVASESQTFKSADDTCYPNVYGQSCTTKGQSCTTNSQCCSQNCNAGSCTGCSHSYKTQEWGPAQFEEGLADFLGSSSAFYDFAYTPIICTGFQNMPCPPDAQSGASFNIETSPNENCTTADARYQLNTTRYMFDVYDVKAGPDQVDVNFYDIINAIHSFPDSAGENGKNEPWNASLSNYDDLDGGRSTRDFQQHLDSNLGINPANSAILYNYNCNFTGD